MKRTNIFALVMVLVLGMMLSACGYTDTPPNTTTTTTQTQSTDNGTTDTTTTRTNDIITSNGGNTNSGGGFVYNNPAIPELQMGVNYQPLPGLYLRWSGTGKVCSFQGSVWWNVPLGGSADQNSHKHFYGDPVEPGSGTFNDCQRMGEITLSQPNGTTSQSSPQQPQQPQVQPTVSTMTYEQPQACTMDQLIALDFVKSAQLINNPQDGQFTVTLETMKTRTKFEVPLCQDQSWEFDYDTTQSKKHHSDGPLTFTGEQKITAWAPENVKPSLVK